MYLKPSQVRCKACAVEFARQLDTDRYSKDELAPDPEESDVRKWPELEAWEAEQIRKARIKLILGIGLILGVMALAAWALTR